MRGTPNTKLPEGIKPCNAFHREGGEDRTKRVAWRLEQIDRMLSWEILQRAAEGNFTPMSEQMLYDRVGLDPKTYDRYIVKPLERFRLEKRTR